MAMRVPQAQLTQRTNALPGARQSIDAPAAAFGEIQAKGLGQFGQQLQQGASDFAQIAADRAKEKNKVDLLNMDTEAQLAATKFLYDPANGLMNEKGGLALDAPQKTTAFMDTLSKQFAERAKDNPELASNINARLAGLRTSMLETTTKHSFNEYDTYKAQSLAARKDMNNQSVALNWADDQEFQKRLQSTEQTTLDEARAAGLSPEAFAVKKQEAVSNLYTSRISAMLSTDQPANVIKAKELYDQARAGGNIDLQSMAKIEQTLGAAVPKAAALQKYAALQTGGFSPKAVFDSMIMRESRGKQLDKNGQPLTSSAGAIGIAQVMPETAKEAAALAGLPWDENLYKTSVDYNYSLGEAYYNKLVDTFKDPLLAAGAYNAGPGKMSEWLKTIGDPRDGKMTLSEFVAKIPFDETRKYIAFVYANTAQAGIPEQDLTAAANELDGKYAGAGQELLTLAANSMKQKQELKTLAGKQALEQIMPTLYKNNGDWSTIPTAVRAQLMQQGIWEEVTKYKGTTNPELYTKMALMPPEELAQADLSSPEYRLNLSETDWKEFTKKQQTIRTDPVEASATRGAATIIKQSLLAAGYETDTSKMSKDDAQKTSLYSQRFYESMAAFQKENNRQPNDRELQGIADKLMIQGELLSGSWYKNDPNVRLFEVPASKAATFSTPIPEEQIQRITAALQAAGEPVTMPKIQEIYFDHIMKVGTND